MTRYSRWFLEDNKNWDVASKCNHNRIVVFESRKSYLSLGMKSVVCRNFVPNLFSFYQKLVTESTGCCLLIDVSEREFAKSVGVGTKVFPSGIANRDREMKISELLERESTMTTQAHTYETTISWMTHLLYNTKKCNLWSENSSYKTIYEIMKSHHFSSCLMSEFMPPSWNSLGKYLRRNASAFNINRDTFLLATSSQTTHTPSNLCPNLNLCIL